MTFNNTIDTEREGQDIKMPVPAGTYDVQVESTEDKATKNGGIRTLYTLSIIGGEYKGRKLFVSFNVICPGSTQAEEIARREIAKMGLACGLTNIRDTNELVRCCCRVKVKVVPAHDQFADSNEVYGYEKSNMTAPATVADVPAAPAPAVRKKTPW